MGKPVWPNNGSKPAIGGSGGKYGAPRGNGRTHAGTDFIGYENGVAILDGEVIWAGWVNNDAGNGVAIKSTDPITGAPVIIWRFHCEPDVKVAKGNRVSAGQHILDMGQTGNATGDCDHVEIRYDNETRTVDPEPTIAAWINHANSGGQQTATRQVVAHAGSNGRQEPTRAAKINQVLPANTVGTFNGWRHGETVEGNSVWFRGYYSGDWFWSGGYTDKSTTGLPQV